MPESIGRSAQYPVSVYFAEILDRDTFISSFEFFPPKTDAGWTQLQDRLQEFQSLEPSFVSVTYGAGGSTRDRTHELVLHLARETDLDPVPHMTCVGHGRNEVDAMLGSYAEAGIDNVLAIRGDIPKGGNTGGDFPHAADLVTRIRQFDGHRFGICVAGFPEGHPETPNRLLQMDHLKAKVDCGADWICTQLFFDNAAFFDWCERCELAGISLPLVAGIMPITSIAGMHRMADLAGGANFPARLQKRLQRHQDDPESVRQVGIQWATEQCGDLIDHRVRGIHFYTLNQSGATEDIYRALGTPSGSRLRGS